MDDIYVSICIYLSAVQWDHLDPRVPSVGSYDITVYVQHMYKPHAHEFTWLLHLRTRVRSSSTSCFYISAYQSLFTCNQHDTSVHGIQHTCKWYRDRLDLEGPSCSSEHHILATLLSFHISIAIILLLVLFPSWLFIMRPLDENAEGPYNPQPFP